MLFTNYTFAVKFVADLTFVFIIDNNFMGLKHFLFAGQMLCLGI